MDWFERITGFRELDYDATRSRLAVEGDELVSLLNGSRHGVGCFELLSLNDLRARAGATLNAPRRARTRVRNRVGDARALHSDPEFAGATFQVASQFNVLEMASPSMTPEHGVTCYASDRTQGPACAIAAGAATIWRNYFAPVPGSPNTHGQTATHQLDGLRPLGDALAQALGCEVAALWTMRNGYALCTENGLSAIGKYLRGCTEDARDRLRGTLAVGVQRGAEVTDLPAGKRQRVTQVFCSALPVAYTRIQGGDWQPFAQLVLEACYEASFLAAMPGPEEPPASTPPSLLLTRVGGGVFGNSDAWIDAAIRRALQKFEWADLDVTLVSYGQVHPSFAALEQSGFG